MVKVALVKGDSKNQNIHNVLSLIREDIQASIKQRKKVLIKPNLTALDNIYANTDISAVEAVIDFMNGLGNRDIIVGESSGSAYFVGKNTWDVFRYFGYDELVRKYSNVRLINFDEYREYVMVPVKTIYGNDAVKVIKPFWDYTISMAIPKTHDYAIATFSLKNMMGLVAREDRLKIHGLTKTQVKNKEIYKQNVRLIHKNLFSLIKLTKPDLAVIDGYYGMQGDGPVNGEGIKHGIAIASLDAVKADALASICMGLDPEEIGYLQYCARGGIGSITIDNIQGTSPEKVRIKYRLHRDYEYQKNWKQGECSNE